MADSNDVAVGQIGLPAQPEGLGDMGAGELELLDGLGESLNLGLEGRKALLGGVEQVHEFGGRDRHDSSQVRLGQQEHARTC